MPKSMAGRSAELALCCTLALSLSTPDAAAQGSNPLQFVETENFSLRGHFQAGVNAVTEQNLFWNFADRVPAGVGFDSDADWLELYAKPGLSFDYEPHDWLAVYGKISGVSSYTASTDAYDASDTGTTSIEEGYLGLKLVFAPETLLDLSAGPRELRLGTGMLISNGGSNGFERGALKFGPRKAWEMSAIGRLKHNQVTLTGFYIDPNELATNDSFNELAGADLRYDGNGGGFLGLTYIDVLESRAPYPQAAPGGVGPPVITPGARKGLNTVNLYARTDRIEGALANAFFAVDFAYQWHDRIDLMAWAGRLQAGYTFASIPWQPTLTYSYQTFSGDDPNTTRQERFDPLYYDGSPSAWATGSKSAMVFINSNVQSHGLALRVQPSQRDTITLRYAHIRVNELRSPVQFGQATRLQFSGGIQTVFAGVTDPHLSDDFFIEYNRVLTPNTFLTAGLSVSVPGPGLTSVFPGSDPVWTGGFVNVVVNY